MLIYWLLFLYFAIGAVREDPRPASAARPDVLFRLGCLFILLLIGLRFQVGADWIPYEEIFNESKHETIGALPATADPGYYFVNIVVQWFGGELWVVNLVCGLIFAWGLMRLCEAQERPWLAALVAVPYLVIVVAMGYSRQAVAIAFIMAGLASYFRNGSVLRFAAYVLAAATFHKTAVVALPLIAIANERGRFVSLLVVAALTYLTYHMFLSSTVSRLVTNYIDARYAAEGAGIRIAMNLVPAALFLVRSRQLGFPERERLVWRNIALVACALLPALLFLPSSAV
ncbi:MAG TPA: EpsG family protein, partial [Sphingomicrobium sp.]